MANSMNADQLRVFVALHLDAAPHDRPSWASFRRHQRDLALRSAAVAAAALATAACGGDTTDSDPETEVAGTGSAATGGDATGGLGTGGGILYGLPYETGGVSGGGSGGSGGTASGGSGGVDSGGTGGVVSGGTGGYGLGGLGGTLYGTGGIVELGGTGGVDSGGTGGVDTGGAGGTGGIGLGGLGGTVYGIGGIVELGGTGGTGGLGLGGTAYGIPYEYDCWDGYDNDYDGYVDCDDLDCNEQCQGWLGCDETGAVCSEVVLDTYLTEHPDCLPASSNCELLYPCDQDCPIPDPSQAVPPSGNEWEGCTEDGLAVCAEVVRDVYFDARPQCAAATCGDGPYFPCAPMCGERGANEYPAGSSDNWSGCRGNGIAVCTELANSVYFENHPACIPNDTCGGVYSACNEICPPPTDAETP